MNEVSINGNKILKFINKRICAYLKTSLPFRQAQKYTLELNVEFLVKREKDEIEKFKNITLKTKNYKLLVKAQPIKIFNFMVMNIL